MKKPLRQVALVVLVALTVVQGACDSPRVRSTAGPDPARVPARADSVRPADPLYYDVRFGSIQVRNTRSRGADTLYASIAVSVNGVSRGPPAFFDGVSGRNFNNGFFPLFNAGREFIRVPTGAVNDGDTLTVTYTLINSGSPVDAGNYRNAADAISTSACKSSSNEGDTSGWACIAARVGRFFVGWLVVNCDGLVAADSFTISGKELRERSQQPPGLPMEGLYGWGRSKTDIGSDSPQGCGSISNYRVDLFLVRPRPRA
jgi:hypothetical protein